MKKTMNFLLLSCLTTALFAETPAPKETAPAPQTGPINCEYHFSKDTKVIDPSQMQTWSKNATLQLFTFNNAQFKDQLSALKNCFTEQGWQGFNTAFEKSGNLNAIQSKQLSVSSELKGDTSLQVVKDNQWKSTSPIEVTYQNKEQKLNQSLTVNLLITRKPSGDLGIMQVIAVPKKPNEQKSTPTPP